jgi:hypothetical protein
MAKKINVTAVKTYLFKHGEKIALGVCVFLALFLGIVGLWRSMGAGKADKSNLPWADAFKASAIKINQLVQSQQPKELEPDKAALLEEKQYEWKHWNSNHIQGPLINVGEDPLGDKRHNPIALTPKREVEYMNLRYVRGLSFVHEYDARDRTVTVLEMGGDASGLPKANVPPMPPVFGQPGIIPPGSAGSLGQPMRNVRPIRAVVGEVVFPMKQQVQEFQKALRVLSQKQLFDNPEDLPRPLGFTLVRFEILPSGETADPNGVVLFGVDPKTGKLIVADSIQRMLRDSIFDDETPEYLSPYIFAGLTMPMPKLANVAYPKPKLPGIDVSGWPEEGKKGRAKPGMIDIMPVNPGKISTPGSDKKKPPMMEVGEQPKGPEYKKKVLKYKEVKAADPALADRLFGKDADKASKDREKDITKDLYVYHALGEFPEKAAPPKIDPKMPPPIVPVPQTAGGRFVAPWTAVPRRAGEPDGAEPMPQPMPPIVPPVKGMPEGQIDPNMVGADMPDYDRDAVLRFIDPDVKPGKSYQYAIQVRIANPNHKKDAQVAFAALAKEAELKLTKDHWVYTPVIAIPEEYHLFVVDQQLLDEWATGKVDKKAPQLPKDAAAFQVHQWLKTKYEKQRDQKLTIGDWAIAERIVVQRGDQIGVDVPVQVPVWRPEKDDFEMPALVPNPKDKKKEMKPGIQVNLMQTVFDKKDPSIEVELSPPVLVDFVGGRKFKNAGVVEEEVAVDALILTADGRLEVHNSRVASDAGQEADKDRRAAAHKEAHERQERVLTARQRAEEFRSRGAEPAKKGGIDIPRPMP